jgi:hypothetical protein
MCVYHYIYILVCVCARFFCWKTLIDTLELYEYNQQNMAIFNRDVMECNLDML